MDSDTAALLSSLDGQRNHVLGILEGLPDEALRRSVLPSGWTCLGMVQHLTISDERFWFRGIVAGEPVDLTLTDDSYKAAWQVDPETTAASVFDAYRTEIERSNEIISSTSLDTPPAFWPEDLWPNWRLSDLRAILLHVITETACHAGHLDAARELIDGRTWLD
jgi:uncharacterized damage-inducible protein DinB